MILNIKEETSIKTKSGYRAIPLSKRAIEIINLLNEKNPNHKLTDNLFINKNGNVISRSNVTRTLKSMLIRAKCEVSKCGLHALRHTFGSYLILHKINIKVVSKILGHKDITVTYNIYIHLIEQQMIEAANVFDQIENQENNKTQSDNIPILDF